MNIVAMITWIQNNWGQVISGYLALVGLASWIVKITPTVKDDNILLGIIKFIGRWIAIDKYGPAEVKRPN